MLEQRLHGSGARAVCTLLYYLLPNLEIFNTKGDAVHQLPIPASLPLWAFLYLAGYGGAVLAIACLVLRRRDFT